MRGFVSTWIPGFQLKVKPLQEPFKGPVADTLEWTGEHPKVFDVLTMASTLGIPSLDKTFAL